MCQLKKIGSSTQIYNLGHAEISQINQVIIHEQSEWPEAQLRASNEASVLLPLSNLGRKHILMAQSEAEGPNF